MKLRRWIIGGAATGGIAAVLIVMAGRSSNRTKQLHQSSRDPHPSPAQTAAAEATSLPSSVANRLRHDIAVRNVEGMLSTPIAFYGKVVDQHGHIVPNANVKYTALDRFDAKGSTLQTQTDAAGAFSITRIRGAVLTVGVWKNGYQVIDDKSTAAFAYGVSPDSTKRSPPNRENPAIFVLRKIGPTERLIRFTSGQIDIPKNGDVMGVNLATGRPQPTDVTIQCWVSSSLTPRYDWRYRISVPNGGLVEKEADSDFEAPNTGYEPYIDIELVSRSPKWSSRSDKAFFVKLPDGTYAFVTMKLYTGSRTFAVIDSYVNPTGSRNLEFDPSEAVTSP